MDHDDLPLIGWDTLSQPKEIRGWGTKQLSYFAKTLTPQGVYNLINNNDLWQIVLREKYISPPHFIGLDMCAKQGPYLWLKLLESNNLGCTTNHRESPLAGG